MKNKRIGKFIKKIREEKSLSQSDLSELLHVNKYSIKKWEDGKIIPNASYLIILSNILDVSVNEILAGEKIDDVNKEYVKNIGLKYFILKNKLQKKFTISVILVLILILVIICYFIKTL